MAVGVSASPRPLYHYERDGSHCTEEVLLYFTFKIGTEDCIGWSAPGPGRFTLMKVKVPYLEYMYCATLP
jgi:hypothetical protein